MNWSSPSGTQRRRANVQDPTRGGCDDQQCSRPKDASDRCRVVQCCPNQYCWHRCDSVATATAACQSISVSPAHDIEARSDPWTGQMRHLFDAFSAAARDDPTSKPPQADTQQQNHES